MSHFMFCSVWLSRKYIDEKLNDFELNQLGFGIIGESFSISVVIIYKKFF